MRGSLLHRHLPDRQVAAVLDHQAAVLHDVDALAHEPRRERVVADAALQPHRARPRGEQVVEVLREVLGAAEHVDDVDRPADGADRAEHRAVEDLGGLREVHGHRDDLEAGLREVARHVVRRLPGLRGGLDAQHGDRAGAVEQGGDACLVIDHSSVPPATFHQLSTRNTRASCAVEVTWFPIIRHGRNSGAARRASASRGATSA
jgi:hypothetical protein